MTTARCVLAVVGGGAFAYAWFGAFAWGLFDWGVGMALSATCVLLIGLLRHVQGESRKALRREREAVWRRRIEQGMAQCPSVCDPYAEWAAGEPLIWPRYEMQPGSWRIEDGRR